MQRHYMTYGLCNEISASFDLQGLRTFSLTAWRTQHLRVLRDEADADDG